MLCLDRNGSAVNTYENPTGLFRFLYDCAAGRLLLGGVIRPWLSKLVGRFLDSRLSRIIIGPFIRKSGIDMSEYESGPFRSFNEFFRREILPGRRCFGTEEDTVSSPCDGKLQVFSVDDELRFEIKGISYTMRSLLRCDELAERFAGGTLMLLRLSVDDYHRYAYPVSGTESGRVHLGGVLHTVDPFAAERRPIYCENSREYSVIETESMGAVMMMEVGALMVGRIVNRHAVGEVHRGEEKGFFEFGASSILLCFEKGAVLPDADILKNTAAGAETLVKMGERIALASRTAAAAK